MPNYCEYTMKVVGSEDNVNEFIKRLQTYDVENHFWRIFEATVYETVNENGLFTAYVAGDCAWSLETCCRDSGYSTGVDLFAVNTEAFNVKMEAYSREPGIGFEEHYIYDCGECITDECVDIYTYWWDRNEFPTYEEFKLEYPNAPEESVFKESNFDEVYVGGFGDEYEEWHI